MQLTGKVVIAQGGGPTAVINQSMVGAVLESRKFPQITRVYGAINGVEGIVNEQFMDLSQETTNNLEKVAATPASGLLSTRVKPDEKYCEEIFKVMKAHDVRYFFYIGGNDSSDTVRIVNDYAKASHYDFRAIHIPKTIDNDLMLNDHTPGYGSAARYVSEAFIGINQDTRALPGVYIAVIMGRHAGFLTAAASMAKKYEDDGPHLIYVPERPFIVDDFLADVKEQYEKHGRCVIAVSEGIEDENHVSIAAKLSKNVEVDAHGNIQLSGSGALGDMLSNLIKERLGIGRVRADTLGYAQRNFIGSISNVDQIEAREVGEKAAQYALLYNRDGSVVMDRVGDYAVDYRLVDIAEIAGKTKTMPAEFLNARGNNVTDAFKNYLRPLLGTNYPTAHRLRAPMVEKILKK
ncbi:6-phosphofructokinase [Anaerotalea alkaliphila]|uniref:Pyrophosphate--fructose 6-phosphate 1-phosphotransferase n=1 Tax=Anaerotalea alkaliphila TaxID=2662126 RepID=A0A7X5HVM8_9FIRM|nr:6-phosphofructokinase [Anaerotalea alkaliphila]NDL67408.1 6-phosphofructokinase [Anaerotalea alkaliphila]